MTIPASVNRIGDYAVSECSALTSITIPTSVNSIGIAAFSSCRGLTTVVIPSSVTRIEDHTFYGCSGLVNVTIPSSVTHIGYAAFSGCSGLASVTIPSSVATIGDYAFFDWWGRLASARFLGNAPSLGSSVFYAGANDFTVYFFDNSVGFTTPTWNGYPAVSMGAATPVSIWLLEHNLPTDANLQDDPNRDGVNLLMAYALDLNPGENLSGRMPKPRIEAGQMRLDFHAGRAGVTYFVETSTDMLNWTTDGVVISAPDANQIRTASVGITDPSRYLRLVLVY